MKINEQVAVVSGATRGVGRGIAHELALNGARVFITGRSAGDGERLDDGVVALRCDHRDDDQVDAVFRRVAREAGSIDILVNNVWDGYDRMMENGVFTWPKPFWEQPLWRWDAMFAAGVRASYRASQIVAPMMIARARGLIVNISFWAAQKHIGNVAYGVANYGLSKPTIQTFMADEGSGHGAGPDVLSAYCIYCFDVDRSMDEPSLSFPGGNDGIDRVWARAVVALATDIQVMEKSGKLLTVIDVAQEYGFTDVDGTQPRPLTLANV